MMFIGNVSILAVLALLIVIGITWGFSGVIGFIIVAGMVWALTGGN